MTRESALVQGLAITELPATALTHSGGYSASALHSALCGGQFPQLRSLGIDGSYLLLHLRVLRTHLRPQLLVSAEAARLQDAEGLAFSPASNPLTLQYSLIVDTCLATESKLPSSRCLRTCSVIQHDHKLTPHSHIA